MTRPVIVGSERSEVGLGAAAAMLAAGAGALDAVEEALRRCEDNLEDHYVGTGGLHNARGEVELDASLMVGSTRAVGAVAALQGYPHPISVARRVLEAYVTMVALDIDNRPVAVPPLALETEEERRRYAEGLERMAARRRTAKEGRR